MRRLIPLLLAFAVLLALVPLTVAQTTATLPFIIRVQQGNNSQLINDGGTLNFPADGIGLPSDGSISVAFTGTSASSFANINAIMLTGSGDFAITGGPDVSANPLNLVPGTNSFAVRIRYTPTTSKAAAGKVTFYFTSDTIRSGTFSVNLTGTAPEFAYSYAVQPSGNTSLLNPGDTIQLPQTNLTTTSSVVVILTNRGSGQGTVNNIALSGPDRFVLAGVPFLPATVDAGKDLRFAVQFTPNDFPAVTASVQVDFIGRSLTFKVQGTGLGPSLTYAVLSPNGAAPVTPGGVVTLPDATVGGDKTTVTVRVTNSGNADGKVAALSVSGNGFTIIEAPFIPYTLTAGNSFTFKIQFAPTQPGKAAGRLLVGNDNFDVAGTALGPNLTFAYAAAGGATSVVSGGTVVLPAAAVGQTSTVKFTIKNDGTAPQDVFSISASGTGTVFSASDLPALPRHIAAGESVTFTVTFAPVALGNASGTLKVDTQTFALAGVGNPPAALPDYSFQGASGTVDAAQQPAIGLSLSAPYGLPLTGNLTLRFTSDVFAIDPAVQFASGGQTLAFAIPAGSKQAVFSNGATQMRIQTGTVAGTITVVPTFATAQSGIDLTPTNPAALTLTIPQSAPRLLNVVVSAKTANSITLLVTGYATGRSITQMDFQFTAVSSETLGTSKVTIPVEPTFNAWYQSAASAAYGSQFTATVPFNFAGDIKDTQNIGSVADTVQSVSVTLTNRQGVSTAQSATLK